jgi:hypothetical protein
VIELADVEGPLALFAEGLAGRYLHLKTLTERSTNPIDARLTDQSMDSLYLPDSLPNGDRADYLVLVLKQIGYRECGTFNFNYAQFCQRSGFPQSEVKPHTQPDRDSDFTRLFARFEDPAIARRLFLLLEELRISAYVTSAYPGAAGYLQLHHNNLCAEFLAYRTRFDLLQRRVWGDLQALPSLETSLVSLASRQSSVYTTADVTCLLYPFFHYERDLLLEELNAEVSGTEWMQREARLEDWKEDQEDLSRQMLAVEMLQAEDALLREGADLAGDTRDTSQTLNSLKNERDSLSRRIEMERAALRHAVGSPRGHARSFRYDEWNYLERRYIRRWCRLYEERILPEAGADVDDLRRVIREWRSKVRSRLAQLRPLGLQRVSRVADGDELDLNAVLEARQDIRAGISPDDRTYSRRERVQRDICAAFLVDLSASTDDPIEPPPPMSYEDDDEIPNLRDPYYEPQEQTQALEPRKIIHVQREAMLVMASALDVLGDSFGIYGFSGYGHDCVEFFVAKEPDEPLNARTLGAIAAMQPKRSTRMGPAIRHTVTKLMAAGQSLKLLIVLSDGFPQDCDYGPKRGEHEYGVEDTAKALAEAAAKGIETFCITVDRSGHDYLKRMCPDARYLIIDDIEDLPDALTKVYATLTLK